MMDQPPLPKPNTSTGSAARSILLFAGLAASARGG
jgi:hypothetical protein